MERGHILFKMFGKFCPQGTILFNEKDYGEEAYYIQSGTLRTGVSGRDERLDLGPGDILGEEALLERAPRTCMAEATEDTRLLVIDGRNIDSVVRNGPELATTLMGELMRKLDAAWSGLRGWQTRYAIGKIDTLLGGSAGACPWASCRPNSRSTKMGCAALSNSSPTPGRWPVTATAFTWSTAMCFTR